MADYPTSVPILPIVGSNNYPRSALLNQRNRNIEALCTEIGVNPTSINDAASPSTSAASFAEDLDMFANIFKIITGSTTWVNAAVPMRRVVGMYLGSFAPAGSTAFVGPAGPYTSTEGVTEAVVPYHWVATSLYVWAGVTTSPQPATGSLVLTLRRNRADTTLVVTIPASSTNALFKSTGSTVEFYPGDTIDVKAVNNAAGNSMDVRCMTIEVDQRG